MSLLYSYSTESTCFVEWALGRACKPRLVDSRASFLGCGSTEINVQSSTQYFMEIIKEKTVAFTGNRTLATSTRQPDSNLENVIRTELYYVLEELCQEGKNTFLCGMAIGFDMLAAETVLDLKKSYSDVKLYAIIPFIGQGHRFSYQDKVRYKQLCEAADERHVIWSREYSRISYLKRNDFMVDNCCEVIAYSNGDGSGTLYSIDRATKNKINVLNLYGELAEYFAIDCDAKRFLQEHTRVPDMKYGREGVIFCGNNQPFPVNFEQINSVDSKRGRLIFTLKNDTVIEKSLFSEDCWIRSLGG